jgi:hypothetical protein
MSQTELEQDETKVPVKISICPECRNAIRVGCWDIMDKKQQSNFKREASRYNLDIKTMTLAEYRLSGIELFCKPNCSRK